MGHGLYYAGMRQLLWGFEDRCCRYCWRDLKSALEAVQFEDKTILTDV
jgi:hypothetical protein